MIGSGTLVDNDVSPITAKVQIFVAALAAHQGVAALATGYLVVATVANDDVVEVVAVAVDVFIAHLDRGQGIDRIGIGHIGGPAEVFDRHVTVHVTHQATSGIDKIEAVECAGAGVHRHTRKTHQMVDTIKMWPVFHAPQLCGIYREQHPAATLNQTHQRVFLVAREKVVRNVVAVQQSALIKQGGTATLAFHQEDRGVRESSRDGALQHLGFRQVELSLNPQVGNGNQPAGTLIFTHGVALCVIQRVGLRMTVHPYFTAIDQALLRFGKIQQIQVFHIVVQVVADARVDRVIAFIGQLHDVVLVVVDVIVVIAQGTCHVVSAV